MRVDIITYDDVVGGMCSKSITHEVVVGAIAPAKVAAIPPDAAVGKEMLILRAAKVLQAAITEADAGDVKAAIQRLTAFLAAPEVAAATDPEIRAARRRIRSGCGSTGLGSRLAALGSIATRNRTADSSRAWTQGRSKGEAG